MIYELLEHLKNEIESQTSFKAVVLPHLPGVYSLNTAYIIIPDDIQMEFAITSGSFSNFKVEIYFVTSDCNADDVNNLSRLVMKGYSSAKTLMDKVFNRGNRSYSDEDMDANCSDIAISMKTWLVSGKIPVSVNVTTSWMAIIKE